MISCGLWPELNENIPLTKTPLNAYSTGKGLITSLKGYASGLV